MRKFSVLFLVIASLWSCKKEENKAVQTNENQDTELYEVSLNKAPDFTLNDIHGKPHALSDFKGKYIYMDIWATWCGPCRVQIPFMKQLEQQFKDKNIEFISVSVDKDSDKPAWEKMVNDEAMSGVQLFAGKSTSFGADYQIQYIPTFLLIGKDGEIIMPQAPAPMDYQTGQINHQLVQILEALPGS